MIRFVLRFQIWLSLSTIWLLSTISILTQPVTHLKCPSCQKTHFCKKKTLKQVCSIMRTARLLTVCFLEGCILPVGGSYFLWELGLHTSERCILLGGGCIHLQPRWVHPLDALPDATQMDAPPDDEKLFSEDLFLHIVNSYKVVLNELTIDKSFSGRIHEKLDWLKF